MKPLLRLLALALALWIPAATWAGTACEQRKLAPDEVRKAMQMAWKTRQFLEQGSSQVAIVGRAGADLTEHGLRYSHAGIVLREHASGPYLFVHLLNACGTDHSGLFDEGLVNFFLDDLFAFEAVVIEPSAPLQRRLVQVLQSDLVNQLHTPAYSMIANPFAQRYQNSNQWLLEVLAAALEPEGAVKNRADAQAVLMRRGYEPDEIHIGGLQRLGAAMFRANVRFDDHDQAEAAAQRYRAVTVRSLARFIDSVDPQARRTLIPLEGAVATPTRY